MVFRNYEVKRSSKSKPWNVDDITQSDGKKKKPNDLHYQCRVV